MTIKRSGYKKARNGVKTRMSFHTSAVTGGTLGRRAARNRVAVTSAPAGFLSSFVRGCG
jgi:hypothetical protein